MVNKKEDAKEKQEDITGDIEIEKSGGETVDISKAYNETLKHMEEGQVVKGRIVAINPKDVLIDIGYKSEGAVSIEEFSNPAALKIGDEVEVLIEEKEDDEGRLILSKRKAERAQSWERIIEKLQEGDIVEGKVMRKIRGGVIVDIGAEAFLPSSHISLRGYGNIDQYMGQTLKFKIIKINKQRKNIILSRKEALQREKELSKSKLLETIEKGQCRKGTVKNITDFGAFVDIGGIDGLLHIADMSWGRISHPSEMLAIGDKLDVMVLDFDKENMKVSLGIKQLTPSPWESVKEKYPVGSRVKGKVVNIVPYGAFIELEKGVEGLVHVSDLSWTRRINNPSEILAMGDIIEAVVLGMDKDSKKISLGIKQTEANPWEMVDKKYPVGTKIKGKVRSLSEQGVSVEIEDGIEGFVHTSDISWTRKINHPQEILKKGQKIETAVLTVDGANKKLTLGIKQLTPDPWPELTNKYPVGTVVEGHISKIVSFGLFIEIEKDIEGLVHISEIMDNIPGKMEDLFKEGDKVKVRVIKLDDAQRKIRLSMKEFQPHQSERKTTTEERDAEDKSQGGN